MLRANNELCLNCTKAKCNGICDALKADMGEPQGKRYARTITWRGITRSVNEWAEVLGVSRQTLYRALGHEEDLEKAFDITKWHRTNRKFKAGELEQTLTRLSTMPLDYEIYWRNNTIIHGSNGLIARYGTIKSAPTNRVSKPVESRAMPEINLSDVEINRKAWIECVLYIIEEYRKSRNRVSNGSIKADMLEWRALEGLTLKRICDRFNQCEEQVRPITMHSAKRMMNTIIEDVTAEAMRRGLIVEPQK